MGPDVDGKQEHTTVSNLTSTIRIYQMTKKNKALLPTTSEPEDNPPTDVATGVPTPGINAEVANESAGETTVPVNETEVTAPDAAPKSAKKKGGLPIHADYELSQVMLKTVEQQTSILLPGLARGVRYTAKQICGKAFWKMLSKGDKIVAGLCMARLVATLRLPLIEAGTNSSNAKVYVLI